MVLFSWRKHQLRAPLSFIALVLFLWVPAHKKWKRGAKTCTTPSLQTWEHHPKNKETWRDRDHKGVRKHFATWRQCSKGRWWLTKWWCKAQTKYGSTQTINSPKFQTLIHLGVSWPYVQVLFKDYVFSSLKHGLHVLDRAHYKMIVPT
jgi:hypothetical protein